MTRTLGTLSNSQLHKIIDAVAKPFENRNQVWKNRRKIRYRDMEQELKGLPLSTRAGKNQALMIFQTEEPNQEVHRRVKRLVANRPRIEVIIYEADPDSKALAQEEKDALKALYKWMNRGKVPPERKVVEYQQADGLGIFKLEYVAAYADDTMQWYDPETLEVEVDVENPPEEAAEQTKARDLYIKAKETYPAGDTESSAKAYKNVTDSALRKCDPPFRLSAPDPLTCVWTIDGDAIDIIVERGKRKVSALLQAYEDSGVRLVNNRLVVWKEGTDAAGSATVPENDELHGDYGDLCDYIEVRTRQEVVIMVRHPQLLKNSRTKVNVEDDYIKIAFDNPFGPYSTGYVLVPGDVTGSHDPAHEFQPAILGTLSLAQPMNVLATIRISAAIDAALAGKYVKMDDAQPPPQLDQSKSDKTPEVKDGKPVAMIPGEVKREQAPDINLDKAEIFLSSLFAQYRFNEVLAGDATSSDSGHKLAIQVSQADTQLVPYQNARADATAELLQCCLYASKKAGVTIYVKELPDQGSSALMNKTETVQSIRAITPDMFDLDANLIVNIGSETPITKFAKWAALEQRYKAGTLSYETLMEQSDVENVADEIARVFEGQTLVSVMQQSIPIIVKLIADKTLAKLLGPPPGAGAGMGGEQAIVGAGGNEGGGGMPGAVASTPVASVGRLPGAGLNPAGPTTGEMGPRVQEGSGETA